MTARLSLPQARRIALQAQGLAKVRPSEPVTARAVGRTFSRLQLVQIDSVNVLSRSHFLPFFARLGAYDQKILTSMAQVAPRKMMEYWAHEASFIRPRHFHDLRVWQNRTWVGAARLEPALREGLEAQIMGLLGSTRALTARQVTARIGYAESNPRTDWGWNWSAVKRTLEGLLNGDSLALPDVMNSLNANTLQPAKSCRRRFASPATPIRTGQRPCCGSSRQQRKPTALARSAVSPIIFGCPCVKVPQPSPRWCTKA